VIEKRSLAFEVSDSFERKDWIEVRLAGPLGNGLPECHAALKAQNWAWRARMLYLSPEFEALIALKFRTARERLGRRIGPPFSLADLLQMLDDTRARPVEIGPSWKTT
jgi:hypothetical protein